MIIVIIDGSGTPMFSDNTYDYADTPVSSNFWPVLDPWTEAPPSYSPPAVVIDRAYSIGQALAGFRGLPEIARRVSARGIGCWNFRRAP